MRILAQLKGKLQELSRNQRFGEDKIYVVVLIKKSCQALTSLATWENS